MKHFTRSTLLALSLLTACGRTPAYDLVIANGRVMDPESGLDTVRNIGIRAGRVAAISATELEGARVIDATGLVVAPGFIDLHEHGQQEESYGLMVRDGVTSALELEVGTGDVATWYAEREGGQLVNYGVSVGHIKARMKVLGDPSTALLPSGIGGSGSAIRSADRRDGGDPAQRSRRRRRCRWFRQCLHAGRDDGRDRTDVPRCGRGWCVRAHPYEERCRRSRLHDRSRDGGEREAPHRARELERRYEPVVFPFAHRRSARPRQM